MSTRFVSNGTLVGLLASMMTVTPAAAQSRKPPPPELQGAPSGPVIVRIAEAEEFLDAYERAGRPRWLIFTDLISRAGGSSKSLADLAAANSFTGRIQSRFQIPGVRFVNLLAADISEAQSQRRLESQDAAAAARVLAENADVDIVLYVQLIEISDAASRAALQASYVLIDLRTGDQLARYSWDMMPAEGATAFDVRRMDAYADRVADRVAREFIEQFPRADEYRERPREATVGLRRYMIRITGPLESEDTIFDLVMSARAMRGMREFDLRREHQTGDTSVMEFEALYADELVRLRRDLRQTASEMLGMEVDVISTVSGQIDIMLVPGIPSTVETMLSGDLLNVENRELRQRLLDEYGNQGSPRIAVMINEEAMEEPEEERDDDAESLSGSADTPEAGPAPGTAIYVSPRIVVGSNVTDTRDDAGGAGSAAPSASDASMLLDTLGMENELSARLIRLGLTVVDLSAAQESLMADARLAERQEAQSDDLAFLLGERAGAEIVISGVGRAETPLGEMPELRYTMRAYRVADGRVLGATSASATKEDLDVSTIEELTDRLAARATGALMAQMLGAWEAPGEVELELTNVASLSALHDVVLDLERRLATAASGAPLVLSASFVEFTPTGEGGVGRYRLRNQGSFDLLVDEIARVIRTDDLAMQAEASSMDRGKVTIRLEE